MRQTPLMDLRYLFRYPSFRYAFSCKGCAAITLNWIAHSKRLGGHPRREDPYAPRMRFEGRTTHRRRLGKRRCRHGAPLRLAAEGARVIGDVNEDGARDRRRVSTASAASWTSPTWPRCVPRWPRSRSSLARWTCSTTPAPTSSPTSRNSDEGLWDFVLGGQPARGAGRHARGTARHAGASRRRGRSMSRARRAASARRAPPSTLRQGGRARSPRRSRASSPATPRALQRGGPRSDRDAAAQRRAEGPGRLASAHGQSDRVAPFGRARGGRRG